MKTLFAISSDHYVNPDEVAAVYMNYMIGGPRQMVFVLKGGYEIRVAVENEHELDHTVDELLDFVEEPQT